MEIVIFSFAVLLYVLIACSIKAIIHFYRTALSGWERIFLLSIVILFDLIALYFVYLAIRWNQWWLLVVGFIMHRSGRPLGLFLFCITVPKETKSYINQTASEEIRLSKILGNPLNSKIQVIDKALEDLFNLCMTNPTLKTFIEIHNADIETIKRIYFYMMTNGAGQWIKGKYIPVAAIADEMLLSFLLISEKKQSWIITCTLLVEYFKGNKEPLQDAYKNMTKNYVE